MDSCVIVIALVGVIVGWLVGYVIGMVLEAAVARLSDLLARRKT